MYFQRMQAVYDASLQTPTSRDWTREMQKYLSGPAFGEWKVDVYQPLLKYRLHLQGYTSAASSVSAIDSQPDPGFLPSVTIRSCRDSSQFNIVDDEGNQLPGTDPTVKVVWTQIVEKFDQGWGIRTVIKKVKGKVVRC